MAISFVAGANVQGSVVYNSSNPMTITKPAGTTEDDFMIAFVLVWADGTSWTGPSGWTEIEDHSDNAQTVATYYKVAGGSEGSDYDFTIADGSLTGGAGCILTFRGVDTSTPFSTSYVKANHYTSEGTTTPGPQSISVVNGDYAVLLSGCKYSNDGTDQTIPSGYSTGQTVNGGAFESFCAGCYKAITSTGTETPGDYTLTNAGAANYEMFTLAIQAAGGGASGNPWNYYAQQ